MPRGPSLYKNLPPTISNFGGPRRLQPKYLRTREELFDALAPTIDETVRYRVAMYLRELCGTVPTDLHRIVMEAAEGAVLSSVLDYTKGNQVLAAEYLGISRQTLRTKARPR